MTDFFKGTGIPGFDPSVKRKSEPTERAWGVLDGWASKPRLSDVGKTKAIISPVVVDSVLPVPDCLAASEVWSTASIGGVPLIGFCSLKVSRERKIDIKAGGGTDGASTTDKGYSPAKITITWCFYFNWNGGPTLGQQFAAFVKALNILEPLAGKKDRPPLSISHPIATVRKIKLIQISKIDGPEIDNQKMHTVTIDCVEWKPPTPTKGTGKLSKEALSAFIRLGVETGKIALESAKSRSRSDKLTKITSLFDPEPMTASDISRAKRIADRSSSDPDVSGKSLESKASAEEWDSYVPPKRRE